ncbi:MAG TPA: ABC transporter permease [Planctomycetota bacterium]|nr:ABC transporter permease [Planctomycetota bacterium]
MENPATTLGRTVNERLANIVEFLGLFYSTLLAMFRLRLRGFSVVGRILLNQIRFTGVHAIGPVVVASLAIGGLVIMQAAAYLPADYVVSVSSAVLVKELVPVLTALILIGRSGTAIAIEIGNMKLNEELAAILKQGIPIEHMVFLPRLLGMVLSFLGLAIFANLAAVFGGYFLARAAGVVPITFNLQELVAGVQVEHFTAACIKVCVFGVVIALTSIQFGLRVKRSVREVPIVTTNAVVRSMIACLLLNVFISVYL